MDVADVLTVLFGGGAVATIAAILKGMAAFRDGNLAREKVILEDLRSRHEEASRREQAWKEEVQWWQKRNEEMGQRIVGGGRKLEIPVLKMPPPPPPSHGGMPVAATQSAAPAVKNVVHVRVEPSCPHLFCHPVTDALGTELARICIACDAQVTNEEWVRVGW